MFVTFYYAWFNVQEMYICLNKSNISTGKDESRARDLFYALWIPDLFMKRVESDGMWSLFCPDEARNLYETWGDEFDALYEK